jgi:hypothetical protein
VPVVAVVILLIDPIGDGDNCQIYSKGFHWFDLPKKNNGLSVNRVTEGSLKSPGKQQSFAPYFGS